MDFEVVNISEPDLIFGGKGEEKDPRKGIERYGPYFYEDEDGPSLKSINIGIIGTIKTIELTKQIIKLLKNQCRSEENNKWLYRDFPGFKKENRIECTLHTSVNNQEKISQDYEINRIIQITNDNERIAAGVNLFIEKIEKLKQNDNPPIVIICALPKDIEEYCGISKKTRGASTVKPSPIKKLQNSLRKSGQKFLSEWGAVLEVSENKPELSYNFRNALKGKAMEFGIPTQILKESTARYILNYKTGSSKQRQEPASFLWNFGTALYYKANGKPWRLAKLRQDSCYVGISFYRSKINPSNDMEISMAQIFTENGEGLVLNGSEVVVDKLTKEAHLSEKQAYDLLKGAIQKYISKSKKNPIRVVIHKESTFNEYERNGFNKAIYELGNVEKDFVTVSRKNRITFLRHGIYPVIRGTSIKIKEKSCLLYTTGFTPRIRTYPGHRIPVPLLISTKGDSDIITVCREILGLTKLNWNTTSFSTYLPITLEFSKKVAMILSEYQGDKSKLQDHYRFYM